MLSFATPDGRFNYRVGGIARRGARTLLHRAPGDQFWTPPGGRVELNETASEALAREMVEETGLAVTTGGIVWVVENFFTYRGERFHEIALYLDMQLDLDTPDCFTGREGDLELEYAWLDPTNPDIEIRPGFLKAGLPEVSTGMRHVVVRD